MTTSIAATYRWTDLPVDHPMEKIDRRRITGEHAMLTHLYLQAGCHVPTHDHANEQFVLVMSGRMHFGIGAEGSSEREERTLGPGEVLVVPPHVPHSAKALEDSILIDVFSPPSEKTGIDRT